MKLKISLGTTSEPKIQYLQDVLNELNIDSQIFPQSVSSGISDQPMTSDETKQGAINRATSAIELLPKSNCGMGIEVGYELNNQNLYEMFCWCVIYLSNTQIFTSKSKSLVLPEFHQQILRKGKYLGEFVHVFAENAQTIVEKEIGEIIWHRKPFITESVNSALTNFLNK